MTDGRIPLVYILSSGRSGSTLLDLVLGAAEQAWTLGEAQILPFELTETAQYPCGCGKSVRQCSFWSSVLEDVPLGEGRYPIEYFRLPDRQGKLLRRGHFQDVVRGRVAEQRRAAAAEYGELNARYFRAILERVRSRHKPQLRWLVDASKDFYRLLWLKESDLFNLRVVHLTKDPRAFVYSMTKTNRTWRQVARNSARWLVQNALARRLCLRAFEPSHVMYLRYEDLATDVEGTADKLTDFLAIAFPEDLQSSFRQGENHAISGNGMRWQNTPIRFDDQWRRHFPHWQASFAKWLTTPVRIRCNYS